MTPAPIIREAVAGDLDALLRCCDATEFTPEQSAAQFAQDFARSERRLVVAEVEGELAGYARLMAYTQADDVPRNAAPPGYYLLGLRVRPELRRRGIGLALSTERLRWIFAHEPEARYFTNVRNRASQALHQKLGFQVETDDFWFPGVSFDGGHGLLFHLTRADFEQRPGL